LEFRFEDRHKDGAEIVTGELNVIVINGGQGKLLGGIVGTKASDNMNAIVIVYEVQYIIREQFVVIFHEYPILPM
jgi:hypothetical protein